MQVTRRVFNIKTRESNPRRGDSRCFSMLVIIMIMLIIIMIQILLLEIFWNLSCQVPDDGLVDARRASQHCPRPPLRRLLVGRWQDAPWQHQSWHQLSVQRNFIRSLIIYYSYITLICSTCASSQYNSWLALVDWCTGKHWFWKHSQFKM